MIPRVALVVDSLVVNGGAERVLEAALEVFPDAPIFTLVYTPEEFIRSPISTRCIHTSFIDRLPLAHRNYRNYIALLPMAIEQFDLRSYEILISFSYAVAHGILTRPDQLHISYTHTPMRQAWHHYHQYLEDTGLTAPPKSWIARLILHYIRQWDFAAAARVDHYLAASHWVARGVWRAYRRTAEVLYPPVETDAFQPSTERNNFFLTVSRQEAHKKIHLIVEAFSHLGYPLLVVGKGKENDRIASIAGENIKILGWQPDEVVKDLMSKARAFVVAGEDDFNITAVEAQAAGCPVIAYGGGGVCETVIAGKTGIFFPVQSVESLELTVRQFVEEDIKFNLNEMLQNVRRFSKNRFKKELGEIVAREWDKFGCVS
jgi:glycosyltransferase involved in cell wall biosynthesis